MSKQLIEVTEALLDAVQMEVIGLSGSLGDNRELFPHAPSRLYITRFLVPTNSADDQHRDPNGDDELGLAPAVAILKGKSAIRSCISRKFLLADTSSTIIRRVNHSTFRIQMAMKSQSIFNIGPADFHYFFSSLHQYYLVYF